MELHWAEKRRKGQEEAERKKKMVDKAENGSEEKEGATSLGGRGSRNPARCDEHRQITKSVALVMGQ